MASGVVFADSFDGYTSISDTAYRGWTVSNGSIVVGGSYGRHGQGCQKANGDNGLSLQLPGTYSELYVGFSVRWVSYTTDNYPWLMFFASESGESAEHQVDLTVLSDGKVRARQNNGSTTLGTSATAVFALNTWQHIEVRVKISDTVGVVQVRADGTLVLDLQGVDTQTTNTHIKSLRIGTWGAPASHEFWFDDVVVVDGTVGSWLGPTKVAFVSPTGAGATTNFTPSTGANWENVDDSTFASPDTTYNTGTSGNIDLYATSLSPSDDSIICAHAVARARKTSTGYLGLKLLLGDGSTTATSGTLDTAQYAWSTAYLSAVFDTPPGGSWSTFDLSLLELGIQAV